MNDSFRFYFCMIVSIALVANSLRGLFWPRQTWARYRKDSWVEPDGEWLPWVYRVVGLLGTMAGSYWIWLAWTQLR